MKLHLTTFSLVFLLAGAVMAQQGVTKPQTESRPTGFRFFNQHLTIKPYVSLSYTYDSNVDSDSSNEESLIYSLNS